MKIKAKGGQSYHFSQDGGIIKHVCCDCQATHTIEVNPKGAVSDFDLVFRSDNRSTAQRRRVAKLKSDARIEALIEEILKMVEERIIIPLALIDTPKKNVNKEIEKILDFWEALKATHLKGGEG